MSSSVDLSVATRLRSILSLPTVRRVCSAYSCCRPPAIKTNVCENRELLQWNQLSWLSRRDILQLAVKLATHTHNFHEKIGPLLNS